MGKKKKSEMHEAMTNEVFQLFDGHKVRRIVYRVCPHLQFKLYLCYLVFC